MLSLYKNMTINGEITFTVNCFAGHFLANRFFEHLDAYEKMQKIAKMRHHTKDKKLAKTFDGPKNKSFLAHGKKLLLAFAQD